jgi:hypothetical protein
MTQAGQLLHITATVNIMVKTQIQLQNLMKENEKRKMQHKPWNTFVCVSTDACESV